ncbi:HlyD family secretion protein [Thermosulfuriphilus sp.]
MRARSILAIVGILLAVFLAAFGSIYYQREKARVPEGFVFASGRLEAEIVTVASRVPGRIKEIFFSEGQEIKQGSLLARLEDAELLARERQAQAVLAEARARYQIAQANLEKLEAAFNKAQKDYQRYVSLRQKGIVSQGEFERVELQFRSTKADLKAARKGLQAAREAISGAQAALAEVRALLDYTRIKAPISGAILRKIANVGEMVSAGSPICLMADLDGIYLKAYVPERQIGLLALGQEARIYVDAFPDKAFPAWVGYISRRAEFTPKEVQTRAERVKTVYALKLYLRENPDHLLTPGLPADALIRVSPKASWPQSLP